MSQHNQAQQQRKPFLQMQPAKREADDYAQSYSAMLDVMRKLYDLYGDPAIGEIIKQAERAQRSR